MNAPIIDINHNGLSGWINISMLIRTSHLKINIKNIECSPKNQAAIDNKLTMTAITIRSR